MPKITKDYAAKVAWKEALNKDNSSLMRMRWFDRFCTIRNMYPNPIPLRDGTSEFRNAKTRDEFDAELDKVLGGAKNGNIIPNSEPERREGVCPSVGLQRNQDDSGPDFT